MDAKKKKKSMGAQAIKGGESMTGPLCRFSAWLIPSDR